MVMPMVPLGSMVTSGEFCSAMLPEPRVATSCATPAVEDDQAVGGRDEHVVVAATGEVGDGHPADDPARGGDRPARECGAVRPVEGPHQPARAGVDAFDDLLGAVAEHVADGRAADGVPAQVGPPGDAAVGVGGEQRVASPTRPGSTTRYRRRSRSARRPGSCRPRSTSRRSGWCRSRRSGCRRRRAPAGGRRWCTVWSVGLAGRRVTALDDLGLPVAVEVGQRRRGEAAVGGEERPARAAWHRCRR